MLLLCSSPKRWTRNLEAMTADPLPLSRDHRFGGSLELIYCGFAIDLLLLCCSPKRWTRRLKAMTADPLPLSRDHRFEWSLELIYCGFTIDLLLLCSSPNRWTRRIKAMTADPLPLSGPSIRNETLVRLLRFCNRFAPPVFFSESMDP